MSGDCQNNGWLEPCRGLIKDIELSNTITLHDDTAAEIALMISLMYERNSESLNELNVEQVLQLCTK